MPPVTVDMLSLSVLESIDMKKICAVILLLVFLCIVASIDFFHTETALQVNENCPACHFHNSIPSLSHYDVCTTLQPPRRLVEETPAATESIQCFQVYLDQPSTRAPPQV